MLYLSACGLNVKHTFLDDAPSQQDGASPSKQRGKSAPPRSPGAPTAEDQGTQFCLPALEACAQCAGVCQCLPYFSANAASDAGSSQRSVFSHGQRASPARGESVGSWADQSEGGVEGPADPPGFLQTATLEVPTGHTNLSSAGQLLGRKKRTRRGGKGYRKQAALQVAPEEPRTPRSPTSSGSQPTATEIMSSLEGCWRAGQTRVGVRFLKGCPGGSWVVQESGKPLIFCSERRHVRLDESYALDLESFPWTHRATWRAVTTQPTSGGVRPTFSWDRVRSCRCTDCQASAAAVVAMPAA